MTAALTVPLSRLYPSGRRSFDSLSFRAPRWQDYLDLGEIEEWQPVDRESGKLMLIRHHDVVAQYAERCILEPASPADLALLDLADVLAVHDAMRDFFGAARTSRKPQTGSSGSTERASTTSGA